MPKHEGLSAPGRPILKKGSTMLFQRVPERGQERWPRSLRTPRNNVVVYKQKIDVPIKPRIPRNTLEEPELAVAL